MHKQALRMQERFVKAARGQQDKFEWRSKASKPSLLRRRRAFFPWKLFKSLAPEGGTSKQRLAGQLGTEGAPQLARSAC